MKDDMIAPGSVIGILGGGQLGRMTALAAAQLGYSVVIFAPEDDLPAAAVSASAVRAAYDDRDALDRFASFVDVVTLEFENVPAEALDYLAARLPVRPGPDLLRITQDRFVEKQAVASLGIGVAGFRPISSESDLARAFEGREAPGILKTRRFGYDGKGQIMVRKGDDMARAWAEIGAAPAILEDVVDFVAELSVITARSPLGEVKSFPPVQNVHENHILRETTAPMKLDAELAGEAVTMAETIAATNGVEGLLAVEMFLTSDRRIVVNELAPRPHNSGHWSIEGARTSQFEQQVRAICNLPLGDPAPLAACRMRNLLGDECEGWAEILSDPRAHLHLYGKKAAKPGRKMGHVTYVLNA